MNNHDIINQEEKKLVHKNKRREKKIKPRMKVSGKNVQKLQKIITTKSKQQKGH